VCEKEKEQVKLCVCLCMRVRESVCLRTSVLKGDRGSESRRGTRECREMGGATVQQLTQTVAVRCSSEMCFCKVQCANMGCVRVHVQGIHVRKETGIHMKRDLHACETRPAYT